MPKGPRGERGGHFKIRLYVHPTPVDNDYRQIDPKRITNTRRFFGYEHGGKRHRNVEEQKSLRLTLDLPLETDAPE